MVPPGAQYQSEQTPSHHGIDSNATRGGWDINAYIDPAVSGQGQIVEEHYDQRRASGEGSAHGSVEHDAHAEDAHGEEDDSPGTVR